MSRRTFMNELRRACSFSEPAGLGGSNDPALPQAIQKRDLWLSPQVFNDFRIDDFHDLPADDRHTLADAVSAFIKIAVSIAANGAAETDEVARARQLLGEVISILQPAIRDEWLQEITDLEQKTEEWCRKHSWPTERRSKQISEALLGEYEAPKLHFFAFDKPFVLEPIGRFAPAAYGIFDLAIIPTYDSTTLARADEQWYVHPVGKGARRPWSEESFIATLEKLAALS